MKHFRRVHQVLGIALITTVVRATQGAAPTTMPVRIETPPGCVRIDISGRVLITDPADADWVRKSGETAPIGIPTTQASDLVTRFAERRGKIADAICGDLPTVKKNDVETYFDQVLKPALTAADAVHPYPVYIVLSAKRLTDVVSHGWENSRFHYNSVNDTVDITHGIAMSAEQPIENAVALIVDNTTPESNREKYVADAVSRTELQLGQSVAAHATVSAIKSMSLFLLHGPLADLPNRPDQRWFLSGLTNVLAARYISMLQGSPLSQFVAEMVRHPPGDPVNDDTINLLAPFPSDDLKPELVAPYGDACDRKSIAVMFLWLNRAGPEKVAPLLDALHKLPPADGPTLVRLIENVSGCDLTPILTGRLRPI